MLILIINGFGQCKTRDSDFIPRVGDKIDMFYKPFPVVTSVTHWPSDETLKDTQYTSSEIQAIITVE